MALLLDLYVKSDENNIYRNVRYACPNIGALKEVFVCVLCSGTNIQISKMFSLRSEVCGSSGI